MNYDLPGSLQFGAAVLSTFHSGQDSESLVLTMFQGVCLMVLPSRHEAPLTLGLSRLRTLRAINRKTHVTVTDAVGLASQLQLQELW